MRLPIATQLITRDGSLAKDALMVNALAEVKGQDNVLAFKRPGLALKMDFTPGAGQGIVCWRGTLYAVSGNVITQGPTENPWPDGSAWTLRNEPVPTGMNSTYGGSSHAQEWAFCPHPDGSVWAFNVGLSQTYNPYGSGQGIAYRTTDGRTWNAIGSFNSAFDTGSPSNSRIQAVFNATLGLFFILHTWDGNFAAAAATVYSSPDGVTWTKLTSNPISPAREYCSFVSLGQNLFIIGGQTGTGPTGFDEVWSSSNGTSWSLVSSSTVLPAGKNNFVHFGKGGKLWCFAPEQDDSAYSSVDGVTWVQESNNITHPASGTGTGIDFIYPEFAGLFYAGGQANGQSFAVYTSVDGITWTQKTANYGGTDAIVRMYACAGRVFIFNPAATGLHSAKFWEATNNQSSQATYAIAAAVNKPVSIVSNSAAAATQYLFIKTTDFAWVLTFGNPGTLTQVTDVDYPAATVPGAVFLDGYIFVMGQDGTIFNSDLENPTSWNSLNFIQAEIEPDFGVAIAKHNDYILAFKQYSLEFFYDAANATGSPLSPLPSSAQKIGCANGDSVAGIDGGIYFLSRTTSQQPSVHWLQKGSLTPQEVATEDVQRFLAQADLTSVRSWAGRFSGHALYVLTLKSEGVTLVYDATSQHWSTFTYRTASAAKSVSALTQANGVATATCTGHGFSDGDPVTVAGATPSGYNGAVNVTVIDSSHFSYFVDPALGATASGTITATGSTESYFPFAAFTACGGKNYVQHETAADVFELSQAYTDDAGAAIDMRCRSMKFDGGTVGPKTIAGAVIVSEETTGNLLMRWSDDDYATFSPYRQIALQQRKPETRNLGRFRRRAFEFRYTGSGAPRLAGIEPEIGG